MRDPPGERDVDDRVGDVVVTPRSTVDGGEAAHTTDEVDRPGRGGVDHEDTPPARRHRRVRQWCGGVDDDGAGASPHRREECDHPPRTEVADRDRPDHQHELEKAQLAERQRRRESEQREAGGGGGGAAEALTVPAHEVAVEGVLSERDVDELPDVGDTAADEAAAADDQQRAEHQREQERHARSRSDDRCGAIGDVLRDPLVLAHEERQPGTPPHLQTEHLAIGHETQRFDRPAPRQHRRQPRQHAERRNERRDAVAEPPGDEADDGLEHREDERLQQDQGRAPPPGEGGHVLHPVAGGQPAMTQVGAALRQSLLMPRHRRGDDEHPGAAEMGPPAQVEVVSVELDAGMKALERPEQIGPYEQAGRGQAEDIPHRVVLLLIHLAGLDERVDLTEPVDAETDVLEDPRVVPRHELRADDPGIRAVELLDELTDRIRVERHVVVQETEQSAALDQAQRLIGGGTEPWVGGDGAHVGLGQSLPDLGRDITGIARHEEQETEVRVVLLTECVEHLGEPVAGFVHDHHGHHGRSERRSASGIHDRERLLAHC